MPGFLRRRGSTSASSSSGISPSAAQSVAGSLPSSGASSTANPLAVHQHMNPPSARSQRKAAEAAWFQQVGQLRLNSSSTPPTAPHSPNRHNAATNTHTANTNTRHTATTPSSPGGKGTSTAAKPNLVASKAQQALSFKAPNSPPLSYRPLPPFPPKAKATAPSPRSPRGNFTAAKNKVPTNHKNANKKKGKSSQFPDVFVVPAGPQIIDHTRATQRVMRSISGLGMEDPVGKYADDDEYDESDNREHHHDRDDVGQDQAGDGPSGSNLPSSHYYSEAHKPQHPSIIYEDMSWGAVPRDMQDLVTVASDPTANTKKGLDWGVWNDSLKNFDPDTFAAVPPVPVFVSKQKKKGKGSAATDTNVNTIAAPLEPVSPMSDGKPSHPYAGRSSPPLSPSRSRPSPLAAPTSPESPANYDDSVQALVLPISPPPLATHSPRPSSSSPKRRGNKKPQSLTSMMQQNEDAAAQASTATKVALGKSIMSLESLTLEDVFPGTTFSRQASSKDSLRPTNAPPVTSHQRRGRRPENPTINDSPAERAATVATGAIPSTAAPSNLARQPSSSNRVSLPSSSFSASSSNLLIAEAALALQLQSTASNALDSDQCDPNVAARSNQLIASALAAAVVSTSSQLQRAGSVPDLKLRQLQSSFGSSRGSVDAPWPQVPGRPSPPRTASSSFSSHRNVELGSSSRQSQVELVRSTSSPERVRRETPVPDEDDDVANELVEIDDDDDEDDDMSDTRIEQLGKTSLHSVAYSTQSDLTDLILLGDDEDEDYDDHDHDADERYPDRLAVDCDMSDSDGETVEVVIMLVDGDDDEEGNDVEREIQAVVDQDGVITYTNSWESLTNGSSYDEVHMSLEVDAPDQRAGSESSPNHVLEEAISRLVREISQSHLSASQNSSERYPVPPKVPVSPVPNGNTQRRGSATALAARRGSFQYPSNPGVTTTQGASMVTPTTALRRSATDGFPYPPSPTIGKVEDSRRSTSSRQRRGSSSSSQPVSMASDIVSSTRTTPRSLDVSAHGSVSQVSSSSHSRSQPNPLTMAFPPSVSVTPDGVFVLDSSDAPPSPGGRSDYRLPPSKASSPRPEQPRRAVSSGSLKSSRSSWRSSLWVIADEDGEVEPDPGDAQVNDYRAAAADLFRPSHEKRALPVSMASIFPDDS